VTPPGANGPDPTCATVEAAGGVSQQEVENRYHFTKL
jgi:hypothetical protein